eukprot:scaffold6216_cov149-Amphora_coffeaeformis.AAC.5
MLASYHSRPSWNISPLCSWSLVPSPSLLTLVRVTVGKGHESPRFVSEWNGLLDRGTSAQPWDNHGARWTAILLQSQPAKVNFTIAKILKILDENLCANPIPMGRDQPY